MSVDEEAKDLLAGKPRADIKFTGRSYDQSVNLVIVKDGRDRTKKDLNQLRDSIRSVYRDQCQISCFKKGHRRIYFFRASDLNEVEAQSIRDYYEWVVKT